MATYTELAGLPSNPSFDAFRDKVTVAMAVQARVVELESSGTANHAERLALAKAIYANPQTYRDRFVRAMIAAYNGASIANILAADDADILAAVAAAWNTFIEAA